ncbi:MAG: hypothetical protein ACRDRA_14180 [Pseudonocardiaceae bacterium]
MFTVVPGSGSNDESVAAVGLLIDEVVREGARRMLVSGAVGGDDHQAYRGLEGRAARVFRA